MIQLYYFSNKLDSEELEQEIIYFSVTYLFADATLFVSLAGYYLEVYKNIPKFNISWLIYLMNTLLIDNKDDVKFWIEQLLIQKKQVEENNKVKHKNKEMIILKSKFDEWILNIRHLLKIQLSIKLMDMGLWETNSILNSKFRFTNYNMLYKGKQTEEDRTLFSIKEMLKSEIFSPLLNENINDQYKIKNIADINLNTDDFFEIMSFPFLSMPYSYLNMNNKEFLNRAKDQLFTKYKLINNKIKDFLVENSNKIYDSTFNAIFKDFYIDINQLLNSLQDLINNDLTFKKIINSDNNCKKVQIYFCVTKICNIVDYYETINILEPFMVKSLKDILELKFDLNSCKFFYYIDIIEPQNK